MKAKNKAQGRRTMAEPESLQTLAFSKLDPDLAEMAGDLDAEGCRQLAAKFAAWRGQLLRLASTLDEIALKSLPPSPSNLDPALHEQFGHLNAEECRAMAQKMREHARQFDKRAGILDGHELEAPACSLILVEAELNKLASTLTAKGRREAAGVYERWAAQLRLSADLLDGKAATGNAVN